MDRFSLKQVIKFNFFRSKKGGVFSNLEKINFITGFKVKSFYNSRERRWAILKIGFLDERRAKSVIYGRGSKKLGSGARIRDSVTLQDNPPFWGRRKIKN